MSALTAFAVAAVLVSPFGWVTARRLLRERAERRAATAPSAAPAPVAGLPDVADVVAAVRAEVLGGLDAGEVRVVVPTAAIGGREADPAIVEALVTDDLRRRELRVTRSPTGELQVRRAAHPTDNT